MNTDSAWVRNLLSNAHEHAQQELDRIRAEPFLGTKHMYRKKKLCQQGDKNFK